MDLLKLFGRLGQNSQSPELNTRSHRLTLNNYRLYLEPGKNDQHCSATSFDLLGVVSAPMRRGDHCRARVNVLPHILKWIERLPLRKKPSTVLPGIVDKIIDLALPELAQIAVEGADRSYQEIRIE